MGKMTEEMDTDVPTREKLEDLWDLVEGIETTMMTTRRSDGALVARPMATQKRRPGMDFWFVTDVETDKIDELAADPHVALAYFDTKTWEWVSVSGTARVSTDRALIHSLYEADWDGWFEDQGGARDGGPDDPRLAIVIVDATSVIYGKANKSKPLALLEIGKARLTGDLPDLQDVRSVDRTELRSSRTPEKKR